MSNLKICEQLTQRGGVVSAPRGYAEVLESWTEIALQRVPLGFISRAKSDMGKPVLMMYHQRSEGIGNLLRCLALARSLSRTFHPVVLIHGEMPNGVEVPGSVELVQLSASDHVLDAGVVAMRRFQDRNRDAAARRKMILQQYSKYKPAVLMIDNFPFGDASHAGDILPLLAQARKCSTHKPLVVCCLQDIQRQSSVKVQKQDDKTAKVLEQFFDTVLMHVDPVFARLEEFFQPKNALTIPVHYTGFLLPGQNFGASTIVREERLLVSAGGGGSGTPLFHAALDAQHLLWEAQRLPMTIVTGPMMENKDWAELQLLSKDSRALTIKRTVPNLGAEMHKVRWSVSQCGYGTATETVASRVSALFVPSYDRRNSEQMERARRLVHWGSGRLLVHGHLNGVSLANEIMQLVRFTPKRTDFDMTGIGTTVRLINQLAGRGAFDEMQVSSGSVAFH